ncbi:hypothetical protein SEA_MADAMATO_9 [Streptomyces phage Madamato]|nr:hypothetical protein SEA_MADAMATO_9 [Streptomyces phage Madamato]
MSNSEEEIARILRHGESVADDILRNERYLSHYGIKGMKWGVRKDEDGGKGGDTSTQKWKKAHKPKKDPTPEQAKKNLAAHEKKSLAKLDEPGAPPKKKSFVSRHKKALIFAGAIAGLYAANAVAEAKTVKSIKELSGKSIDAETFQKHVNHSKVKTWMKNDHIQASSWERDEFTLPAGHEFHRLSKKPEEGFRGATYSVHSKEDYHRYVAQFRQELGTSSTPLHHITFRAEEDIKVPKLSTTLDSLRDALVGGKTEFKAWYTDERVLAKYQELSGGSWDDSHAKGMFDSLRKKGYGAIVDEMDAGVIGETPLVFFAHQLAGKKSNEPLTKEDIDFAEASLVELENRKY